MIWPKTSTGWKLKELVFMIFIFNLGFHKLENILQI